LPGDVPAPGPPWRNTTGCKIDGMRSYTVGPVQSVANNRRGSEFGNKMPPGISQSETEEGRNQKSDAHVALGIPGLLVVDGVDVGDLEEPGVVWLDLRVQALHLGRVHLHPRGGRGGGDARAAAAARAFRLQVQATVTPT